jgi:myo-inositol-1(or 4)-monophosphatase
VAREAGAYLREEQGRLHADQVERKHAHDYVSYVDKTCERQVVEQLRSLLPQAQFLTEEGTTEQVSDCPAPQGPAAPQSEDDGRALTWVVDPLDGTTNFIHGFAPYAVSIALCKGREIMIGVVYEIVADECFYAWKGGGAYLEVRDKRSEVRNEVPLEVSKSTINDALLCLQLPYNSDAYKPVITRLIQHYYGQVGSIRMIGSAAIALCYVAAGRLDAYAERYIGQWDYMAGALIVMEAKGSVTNYAGDAYFMEGDSVVASNGVVHQDLLICTRNA